MGALALLCGCEARIGMDDKQAAGGLAPGTGGGTDGRLQISDRG